MFRNGWQECYRYDGTQLRIGSRLWKPNRKHKGRDFVSHNYILYEGGMGKVKGSLGSARSSEVSMHQLAYAHIYLYLELHNHLEIVHGFPILELICVIAMVCYFYNQLNTLQSLCLKLGLQERSWHSAWGLASGVILKDPCTC